MADESKTPETTQQKPQIPAGYRLVPEDEYKQKASAAADLKKFKSQIEQYLGDYKLEELPNVFEELNTLRSKVQTDLSEENKKLKKKLEEYKQTLGSYTNTIKQFKIKTKVNETLSQLDMPIAEEFIDRDKLLSMDPDAEDFSENLQNIIKEAAEKQSAFLKKLGVGKQSAPFHIPGGSGGDRNEDLTLTELNNKLLEVSSQYGLTGLFRKQSAASSGKEKE